MNSAGLRVIQQHLQSHMDETAGKHKANFIAYLDRTSQ